jgi:maleylpyruvate isomerase
MILHGFWRSSATWRVRIGLEVKGLAYEVRPVHLRRAGGGDQHRPEFREKNPMEQVPVLEVEDEGRTLRLTQSLAILEYLDERWPDPPLLPKTRELRARARQIAEIINSGIQPLQNTGVQQHVKELGLDDAAWVRRWVEKGMAALESVVAQTAGQYAVGDVLSIADVCIVPQTEFSKRFGIDPSVYPALARVAAACGALEPFRRAHADRQPDAGTT